MADTSITPANVFASPQATVEFGIAGVTITAGQALYKDTADNNRMKLADANGATVDIKTFAGIALHGAFANQPIKYATKDPLFVIGTTENPGYAVYLSTSPGAMTVDSATDIFAIPGIKAVFLGAFQEIDDIPAGSASQVNLNPTVGGTTA